MTSFLKGQVMISKTTSQIVWPRPALAACIFCVIVRDTRGVALDQAQRFNYFPASPLCCVTRLVAGDIHLITDPQQMQHPWTAIRLPHFMFSGAQLGPLVSWSAGEMFAITVVFYPDAFSAMSGLDLSSFTGRIVAAKDALPQSIFEPCENFFDVVEREGFETGIPLLEDGIDKIWSNVRPVGAGPPLWLKDWARSLAARAVLSGPGNSARQIARRIKSWTGINARDLKILGHSEQLYANIHEATQSGDIDWAELAAASGFCDQAHMIRRMRKHTGFTPEQLRQGAQSDEALWSYRLLGEYFSKPNN